MENVKVRGEGGEDREWPPRHPWAAEEGLQEAEGGLAGYPTNGIGPGLLPVCGGGAGGAAPELGFQL